jgi:hypothetical protein
VCVCFSMDMVGRETKQRVICGTRNIKGFCITRKEKGAAKYNKKQKRIQM